VSGFCERAVATGLPISRALVLIDTLHPVYEGRLVRWGHDPSQPVVHEYGRTGLPEGVSDLHPSSGGEQTEVVARWRASPFFRRPGRACCGAAFANRIDAVIWFSDLRGFTRITDSAPEQVIPLLNDYADVIVSAIHGQGGDVLKLIGDGVLAIFAAADRARACAAALAAATVAPAHLAQDSRTAARDRRTAATPTLAFGHPYVTRSGPKAPGRSRRPQGASTCA